MNCFPPDLCALREASVNEIENTAEHTNGVHIATPDLLGAGILATRE